jgi:hypothetical protein
MTVKQTYNIGEDVWIFGIASSNKITKGRVVAAIDLSTQGYGPDLHYIIAIPTNIEPLLELRTWHTISQDEHGPVGSFRSLNEDISSNNKKMRQVGYIYADDDHYDHTDDLDPTPTEILAALEKSTDGLTYKPLTIKEPKPKRRYYPKRKKP